MPRPKEGGFPPTGFGARLRRLREGTGLTQAQLAEASGCHANTLARLERGEIEPGWPLVLALARALGVTCEAFNGEAAGEPQEKRPPGRPSQKREQPAAQGRKKTGTPPKSRRTKSGTQ